MSKISNVILLGPPGAGKGTYAELISNKYNICHISTGDLLRQQVQSETKLGLEAQSCMNEGELVPDAVVISMVKERLTEPETQNGYLLDGFPRTESQAVALDEMTNGLGKAIQLVIYLNASKDVILKRLSGRRVALKSGRVYNIYNELLKPKVQGICDESGEPLIQREDDTEATVLNRLDVYKKQTASLIQYYKGRNVLTELTGDDDLDEVQRELVKILG